MMKLCIDCKYHFESDCFHYCERSKYTQMSRIDGKETVINDTKECEVERLIVTDFLDKLFKKGGYCGTSAVYFEPRE